MLPIQKTRQEKQQRVRETGNGAENPLDRRQRQQRRQRHGQAGQETSPPPRKQGFSHAPILAARESSASEKGAAPATRVTPLSNPKTET